jgi:hypothetical protein
LGSHGLTNKECPFHSHEDQGPDGQIGKPICSEYSITSQRTFSDCIGSRLSLYLAVLAELVERDPDRTKVQHCFSPSDRWSIRAN